MTTPAHVIPSETPLFDIEAEDAIDAFVIDADYFLGDDARCGIKGCTGSAAWFVDYGCGDRGPMCAAHESQLESLIAETRAGGLPMICPTDEAPLDPDAISIRPI